MTEIERFMKVKERLNKANENKIRIEERYKHEREKLELLVSEIKNKGYDPAKLAETKQAKEKELEKILTDLEKISEEVTQKLSEIEKQTI